MRFVAYLRVSSEGQVDGYGLDAQESSVRAWAKAHRHRIVGVCKDEGLSGALPAAERPGLACALDALADGTAEGVIVARLDRLARALTIQEAALAMAWKLGGRVFTADAGEVLADDQDDPMRTALRQIVGVIAQLDRALVSKRLRDGRRAKAATGRKAVGDYAYGTRGAGKGRDRDASPDPDEVPVVARILELRSAGQSYRAIAATLDAEGLRPRRASAWSAMSVRNVALRTQDGSDRPRAAG
jgi:DNA invertase Pin-like site-specific DNA recombinase